MDNGQIKCGWEKYNKDKLSLPLKKWFTFFVWFITSQLLHILEFALQFVKCEVIIWNLSEWGCPLNNGPKLAMAQSNSSTKMIALIK